MPPDPPSEQALPVLEADTGCRNGLRRYLRHEGETPMRVWYRLDNPLPHALWQAWSDLR